MAVTEVRLGAAHVAGCLALSAAAGWNQNAADWRLMLDLGEGWGLELSDGTLAASTLVIQYGTFAWISMVLVLPAERRRGFATRLLRSAIQYLARRGLTPILDATPAGREVYRREGFRDAWQFTRCVAQGRTPGQAPSAVRALREDDWSWMRTLDRIAFGGDREPVLRSLCSRLPAAALVVEGEGFILGRDGRQFSHLGPLVASSAETAGTLLDAALTRVAGPLYLDIAEPRAMARAGFAEQRVLTRMVHGAGAAPGDRRKVFVVAGPELG